MSELLLYLIASLLITAFGYLFFPGICCLTNKKFTKKQIKTIVIVNGVCVWLLFQIISISLGGTSSFSAAVFLWSAIANVMLKKHCLKTEHPQSTSNACKLIKCNHCGYSNPDSSQTCILCKNTLLPAINQSYSQSETATTPSTIASVQYTANNCSICGNPLIQGSCFCRRCGFRIDK